MYMAMAEEDLPREGGGGEGCLRKGSGVWGRLRKVAEEVAEVEVEVVRGRWMGGTPRTGLRTARGVCDRGGLHPNFDSFICVVDGTRLWTQMRRQVS